MTLQIDTFVYLLRPCLAREILDAWGFGGTGPPPISSVSKYSGENEDSHLSGFGRSGIIILKIRKT